jgi:hypothetical protein
MSRSLWWRNKTILKLPSASFEPSDTAKTLYVTDTTAAGILWRGLPTLHKGNSRQHKILPVSRILSELIDLSFVYPCEESFECPGYIVVATRKTLQLCRLVVLRSSSVSVLIYIGKEDSVFIRGSGDYLTVTATKRIRRLEFSLKIQWCYTW